MKRIGASLGVVVVGVIGLAACDDRDPGGGGPPALEALCERYLATFCRWAAGCGLAASDAAACRVGLNSIEDNIIFCGDMSLAREAVRLGEARYDPVAAGEFLVQWEARSCDGQAPVGQTPLIFTGLINEGGACNSPISCGAGLYCDELPSRSSVPRTPGTCAPLAKADEVCMTMEGNLYKYRRCEESLFCDLNSAAPVCAPLPTEGRPCRGGSCAAGLLCSSDVCVKAKKAGEPCSGSGAVSDCGQALVCHGVCVPLADTGGACSRATDVSRVNVDCRLGLYCRPSSAGEPAGSCRPLEPRGAACVDGACAAPLLCSPARTCSNPPGV